MKETEVLALLTKMAAYDQRTIGEADVAAWHEVLPDEVGLSDALALVPKHYATSRARMMPADVIEAVTAMRKERLQRAGTPPIPCDLTWSQEKAWRQLWCAAVKDGDADPELYANEALGIQPKAIEATSESVAELRRQLVSDLADRKAAPEPEPQDFRRSRKPRTRWGCWSRGSENADGVIVFRPDGQTLYHDGGPYGIEISALASEIGFWIEHIADKAWGNELTLHCLASAYLDITNAGEGMTSHVGLLVEAALGQRRESADFDGTVAELLSEDA